MGYVNVTVQDMIINLHKQGWKTVTYDKEAMIEEHSMDTYWTPSLRFQPWLISYEATHWSKTYLWPGWTMIEP